MGHKCSVLLTVLRGMLVRMAACVRKAGGGVVDSLLGQSKCKQMCCVIKTMQQESSSLFAEGHRIMGTRSVGICCSLVPSKEHTPTHTWTQNTHSPQSWNSLARQSLAPWAELRSTKSSSLLTGTVDEENKQSGYLDVIGLTAEWSLKTMTVFRQ